MRTTFAAKLIIRFEEAKDRTFVEYYLIGILTSLTFTTLTGIIFATPACAIILIPHIVPLAIPPAFLMIYLFLKSIIKNGLNYLV